MGVVHTQLEYLLYYLAKRHPEALEAAEAFVPSMLTEDIDADARMRRLADKFFQEQRDHRGMDEVRIMVVPGDHRPTAEQVAAADVVLKLKPPSARLSILSGEAAMRRFPQGWDA